jgi:hypothetical protein
MLRNPEIAKRVIIPGGVANHLRGLGRKGPSKAERDKQKQEVRIAMLKT